MQTCTTFLDDTSSGRHVIIFYRHHVIVVHKFFLLILAFYRIGHLCSRWYWQMLSLSGTQKVVPQKSQLLCDIARYYDISRQCIGVIGIFWMTFLGDISALLVPIIGNISILLALMVLFVRNISILSPSLVPPSDIFGEVAPTSLFSISHIPALMVLKVGHLC